MEISVHKPCSKHLVSLSVIAPPLERPIVWERHKRTIPDTLPSFPVRGKTGIALQWLTVQQYNGSAGLHTFSLYTLSWAGNSFLKWLHPQFTSNKSYIEPNHSICNFWALYTVRSWTCNIFQLPTERHIATASRKNRKKPSTEAGSGRAANYLDQLLWSENRDKLRAITKNKRKSPTDINKTTVRFCVNHFLSDKAPI